METLISHLPADVFGIITPRLTYREICRLAICGSKRMTATLGSPSAVRSLELKLGNDTEPRVFPNLAALLPTLRHLYVGNPSCSNGFVGGLSTPIKFLPTTLEHMEMSFWECERWFSRMGALIRLDFPPPLDISTPLDDEQSIETNREPESVPAGRFPSLKTLILRGVPSPRITTMNFTNLAPYLETLKLDSAQSLSEQAIGTLPPTLTVLSLPNVSTLPPKALTFLPSSITSLSIQRYQWKTDTELEQLPRNLFSLNMRWISSLSLLASKHLPRSLTSLEILALTGQLTTDWARGLPNTLLRLHAKAYNGDGALPYELLPLLPPHIRDLCGALLPQKRTEEVPFHVPMLLVVLEVCQGSMGEIEGQKLGPLLPSTLRELVLHGYVQNIWTIFDYLPSELHTLSIRTNRQPDSQIQFPLSLTSLDIGLPGIVTSLSHLLIPPSLTELKVHATLSVSIAGWLTVLPNSLKVLHFSSLPCELVQLLPKSLRKLTVLSLIGILPLNTFAELSRTMEELLLPNTTAESQPHFTAQLPTQPSAGRVKDCVDSSPGITDSSIALLPRSLTSLDLSMASNLTSACFPDLPPNIDTLHLPEALFLEWKRFRREGTIRPISVTSDQAA